MYIIAARLPHSPAKLNWFINVFRGLFQATCSYWLHYVIIGKSASSPEALSRPSKLPLTRLRCIRTSRKNDVAEIALWCNSRRTASIYDTLKSQQAMVEILFHTRASRELISLSRHGSSAAFAPSIYGLPFAYREKEKRILRGRA
jgi:hypothetical protein